MERLTRLVLRHRVTVVAGWLAVFARLRARLVAVRRLELAAPAGPRAGDARSTVTVSLPACSPRA